MSLTQFCFSARQAGAGLRSSLKKEAVGQPSPWADRVSGQSGLRPGHGSRFTAEVVRLVTAPSASSASHTLGVDFTSASVNGQPARMLPGNVFEANLDLPPGPNTVTIKARDGNGNEAVQNYSVNVAGGAATYTYDLNGNLKTKTEGADVWVYEWNALNQLVEVKRGTTAQNATSIATFAYDPIGRRIEKVTPTKTVTYTYDGADILRENVTTSGSPVTSFYVHGPGIDEPLSKETGGVVTYYHADGLGSIAKETNGSGMVVNTLRYDAWGNIEMGAREGFAFTGREWDPETGLYYYRARYYDPGAVRFISQDPIGFAGGMNLYGYVGNQPINRGDPAGNDWVDYVGTRENAEFWAGLGDNLTFGATKVLRDGLAAAAGWESNPMDECSDWYQGGQTFGDGLGAAMLGAGPLKLGLGASQRALKFGAKNFFKHSAKNPRQFAKTFWRGTANGRELHHWLVPVKSFEGTRLAPFFQGGWNQIALSGKFNNMLRPWSPQDILLKALLGGGLSAPLRSNTSCACQ